jgi:hypothetical protein
MNRSFQNVLCSSVPSAANRCCRSEGRTDYDHAADFSRYKTYKWVKVEKSAQVSQLADQRITGAI